tara:strand:- start:8705 stop:9787 length:1083 start_codon:yes stop_codon:yes gene_type:complete
MVVVIKKTNLKNIDKHIAQALQQIKYQPKKKKVMIKPNLVYGTSAKSGIITHPRLVEALIKFLQKFDCEITIAEGSGVGHNTKQVFKKTGYEDLAKKYNVKLLDLNTCERKEHTWKYGKIKLPKILEDYEYINVPTLKTHTITTVTLGTKNQKGLLDWPTKKSFHIIGVDESVRALADVVQPDLTVINALYCLEGNSISLLKTGKRMDLIIAGQDMFETDNIGIQVMQTDSSQIKHFPIIKDIKVVGEKLEKVKTKFAEPQKIRKILNIEFQMNGCSGCSVNMERTMKKIAKHPLLLLKFFYLALFKNITFVSGHSLKRELRKGTKVIYVGVCTKKISNNKYIQGCPPDPDLIIEAIRKA